MQTGQHSMKRAGELGIFSLMASALALPPAKCEALERRDARAAQGPVEASPRRHGLFDRLNQWLWTRQQRDIEAYLAKATDIYDLEARIRMLERNVSRSVS